MSPRIPTLCLMLITCLPAPAGTGPPEGLLEIGVSDRIGSDFSSTAHSITEKEYVLTARIRLLLPWLSFRDVGGARICWSDELDDQAALALLIGSDPAKAPRKINRWGFVVERGTEFGYQVVGVMTEADDESVKQARAKIDRQDGIHVFKVTRGAVRNGTSETLTAHLPLADNYTYHDVRTLVDLIPNSPPTRSLEVPAGARPGFLFALKGLIRENVESYHRTGRPLSEEEAQTVYVFNSRLYELFQTSAKIHDEVKVGSARYTSVMESRFKVRNVSTDETTGFKVFYGVQDPIRETPVRIVYRPKWWFEAELELLDPGALIER